MAHHMEYESRRSPKASLISVVPVTVRVFALVLSSLGAGVAGKGKEKKRKRARDQYHYRLALWLPRATMDHRHDHRPRSMASRAKHDNKLLTRGRKRVGDQGSISRCRYRLATWLPHATMRCGVLPILGGRLPRLFGTTHGVANLFGTTACGLGESRQRLIRLGTSKIPAGSL
jgi:hypothetical protein